MALLLPMPSRPRPEDVGIRGLPMGAGVSTAASPPTADFAQTQRAQLGAALENWTYAYIVDVRMAHIPLPRPYPRAAILARLRENDRTPPNKQRRDRQTQLDTDLRFAEGELERSGRETSPRERKQRRLSQLWDYMVLNSDRNQNMVEHREGKLRYNVSLFFRSDLPPVYLTEYGSSTHWEIAALILAHNAQSQRLFQRVMGKTVEEVDRDAFLGASAPLREIDQAFRDYKARFAAVTTLSDRVLEWRDALGYYVDLFSAPDLPTFLTQRHISMSSLDAEVIDHLVRGLRKATADLRHALAASYAGGLAEFPWFPRDDAPLTGLIRLELEAGEAA